MTKRFPVSPLIDFCSAESTKQYECGVWWRLHGWRADNEVEAQGPLPDSYFVENLKACVARHEFDPASSEHSVQQTLCFLLGMLHGGVLSPTTGLLRPNVTTLVVVTHHEFARGHNVGRRWYFFDAMPDEDRHYTEVRVMQEIRDLLADIPEEFVEGADDKYIQYCVGTLLGAISARLFPATKEEYRQWEADRQYWLALSHSEHVTEPLAQRVPQHV